MCADRLAPTAYLAPCGADAAADVTVDIAADAAADAAADDDDALDGFGRERDEAPDEAQLGGGHAPREDGEASGGPPALDKKVVQQFPNGPDRILAKDPTVP